MTITKIEAARRQLITSIRLLFEDADSISVYTLAHASWEVLDALCKHEGKLRFREQMASATGKGEKAIKEIANFGKNFFKHADSDPEGVLEDFSDDLNDHVLLAATMDYGVLATTKPMEVQFYPLWYFGVYPEKLLLPAMAEIRDTSETNVPRIVSRAARSPESCRALRPPAGAPRQGTDAPSIYGRDDCQGNSQNGLAIIPS
jgi:hypothetical protein